MNDVFKAARGKGTKFSDNVLKRLKDEYDSQKEKDATKDIPKKASAEKNEIAQIQRGIEQFTKKLEE